LKEVNVEKFGETDQSVKRKHEKSENLKKYKIGYL